MQKTPLISEIPKSDVCDWGYLGLAFLLSGCGYAARPRHILFSLSELTRGSRLTRQAIAKHLRVLEEVGIIHSARCGRESVFKFDSTPLREIEEQLNLWSEWRKRTHSPSGVISRKEGCR
jgi:DNA-binding transcriptional ArsR family regulator